MSEYHSPKGVPEFIPVAKPEFVINTFNAMRQPAELGEVDFRWALDLRGANSRPVLQYRVAVVDPASVFMAPRGHSGETTGHPIMDRPRLLWGPWLTPRMEEV